MIDTGLDFAQLAQSFNRTFVRKTYHLGDENTALLDGEWFLIDDSDYDVLRPVMDFERTTYVRWVNAQGVRCSQKTEGRLAEHAHAVVDGHHYVQMLDPNGISNLRSFISYGLAVMQDA